MAVLDNTAQLHWRDSERSPELRASVSFLLTCVSPGVFSPQARMPPHSSSDQQLIPGAHGLGSGGEGLRGLPAHHGGRGNHRPDVFGLFPFIKLNLFPIWEVA